MFVSPFLSLLKNEAYAYNFCEAVPTKRASVIALATSSAGHETQRGREYEARDDAAYKRRV
jgi:hypothetical protein